jgi:carbonic anhydrase/acetyltransferase-like protein (isoleucine patch superfamily)
MKNHFKKKLSFLFVLINKLFESNFSSCKSIVFLSKFRIKKTNSITLLNAVVERSSIVIDGNNNRILIQGNVSSCKVNIWGNNNQIVIHQHVKINNSTIVLRGNDCNIELGQGSTFGGIYLVCMGLNNFIKIGENCMFGENINLWNSDSHPIFNTENDLINSSKPITIGNSVWVGLNSTILKGVTIGSGSIIGMSSVVTKNIEPATLNVGCPARSIKSGISWKREFINS